MAKTEVYEDKKTKAEDCRSSAYVLIIVGVLGIAALVLLEVGVFPIRLAAPGKYITYGVMGVMFIIFIISGINSFRSAKVYESAAVSENEQTAAIKAWAKENLSKEMLTERANEQTGEESLADMPQEQQYFHYESVLREAVTNEFGTLNTAYLDEICEELYADIFDEERQ